jgi:endoglycosylceramidase
MRSEVLLFHVILVGTSLNLVSWHTGPPTLKLLRGAKRKTLQEDERLATRGVGMGGGALNVLLPLLLVGSSGAKVRVDPQSHTFVEDSGQRRELFFHGVNYVRKGAPFIADVVDDCDPILGPACPPPQTWTLTADDVLQLEQRGMNVVRLGVMWPGAMPEGPGKINATYFDQVERIVDLLWKYGVYTIIDLHQDVLSPRICGEGAPLWVKTTRAALGGLPFPLPLGLKPLDTLSDGLPNCSAAPSPIGWSSFYLSDTCGRAFEAIYHDTEPQRLGRQLEIFWSEVAKRLAKKPGVAFYELLNEPWVGDSVEHPEYLLQPGRADRDQLVPFYRRLHDAIRAHDNETLILYSGMEVGDRLTTAVGFEEGPGGPSYDAKQALVMHNYCAIGTDGGGPQPGTQRAFCDVTDGKTFAARDKDKRRLNTALFMTEFGATGTSATGLKEVSVVADGADALHPPVSWAYWAWDAFKGPNGNTSATWSAISRSYAPVIDGRLEHWSGGGSDSRFEVTFTTGVVSGQGDSQTHIYFAPGLKDAKVTVQPEGAVDVVGACGKDCTPHATEIILFNNKANTKVTVVIEK